jgi:hypothetical protein
MTDPTASPWWVVAMASLPSIASGFWVSWRWWVERGDKLHDGSGQVELVGIGIEGNRAELGVLAKRVEALEEPVRKNIAEREAQRRVWKRVARWAAAIGAVAALMWRTIVEPIWKDVIPHLLQQMFHW